MAGDGTWCCYPVPGVALGPAGSCSKSPLEPSFLAPPPPPVDLILQNIRNIMTTSSRPDLRNFSFVQSEFLYPDPVYFLDRLSCFLRRISALCFAAAFHSYFFRPCAALCHICYRGALCLGVHLSTGYIDLHLFDISSVTMDQR